MWSHDGRVSIVEGPARVFLFRKRLELLPVFLANQKQYLEITHQTGMVEIQHGPCRLYKHPLLHSRIVVRDAVDLTSNEVLVVYRPAPREESKENTYASNVSRFTIHGPAIYMPTDPEERVHEFVWHGRGDGGKTKKVPGALRFTKLMTNPRQTYFNVTDARCADHALVQVKVMIFFRLLNIDEMVDKTSDPIGDFVNSVAADVVSFLSTRKFSEFLAQSSALNELESYPNLVARAAGIGYQIDKVVYRGYQTSDKVQAIHDKGIERRTHLHLEQETLEQEQRLATYKLNEEMNRARQRREMEAAEREHAMALERIEHDSKLRAEGDERQAMLQHLSKLKELGVDITKCIMAQYQQPEKLIQIQAPSGAVGSGKTGAFMPSLQLHKIID